MDDEVVPDFIFGKKFEVRFGQKGLMEMGGL